jgi:hypothetical protein
MTQPTFKFKARTYLHFDLPLSEAAALRLVTDPKTVQSHSFYPFVGYTLATERLVKDESGKIVRDIKKRDIKIAAHRDSAIYSFYSQVISELYEKQLQNRNLGLCVRAFRSVPGGGTNIDFAAEVFDFIDSNRPCEALGFDITKFFDRINHSQLKTVWQSILGENRLPEDHFKVFRSLTNFSWVSRDKAFAALNISKHNPKAGDRRRICLPSEFRTKIREAGLLKLNPERIRGIPQGSPISAVLSNLYLLEFDTVLSNAVKSVEGLYRRYCDDIMVVVPVDRAAEMECLVKAEIAKCLLEINDKKTDKVIFETDRNQTAKKPIQYLGFTYDGKSKLLRLSSLNRYYGKMRRGVALAKQTQRKYNRLEGMMGVPLTQLKRRKLYVQYSYLIERRTKLKSSDPKAHGNFLTYAYRAASRLQSPAIKKQVRNHWRKLQEEIYSPIKGQLRDP